MIKAFSGQSYHNFFNMCQAQFLIHLNSSLISFWPIVLRVAAKKMAGFFATLIQQDPEHFGYQDLYL